jgi:hypothetical protein
MKKSFSLFLIIFLLAAIYGCASAPSALNTTQALTYAQKNYPNKTVIMTRVEGANNAISTGIMIASLKAGTASSTSDAIKGMLTKGAGIVVLVSGTGAGITSATLERALKDLTSAPQVGSTLVIAGQEQDYKSIVDVAKAKGIQVDFFMPN